MKLLKENFEINHRFNYYVVRFLFKKGATMMRINKLSSTIAYIILVFIIIFNPMEVSCEKKINEYSKDDLQEVKIDIIKEAEVLEEGAVLVFKPDKDGKYSFEWGVEQVKKEDNIETNYHIIVEVLDENMDLLNTNAGSKYDVYDNSYHSGEDVAIGEGGDSSDSPWYYAKIEQNCFDGETYYIRLNIPEEELPDEDLQELFEDKDAVPAVIDESGEIVEHPEWDFKVRRNAKVLVSYQGPIEQSRQDENKGGILRIFLYILIGIFLLIIIKRIKNKNNNKIHKQNEESTNNHYSSKINAQNKDYICKNCGKTISQDDKFCTNCGNKIK